MAVGALVSFSTQIGPVYLRVDRLGLAATVDTMTPSEERNLRLVQAGVDAARPPGIALNLETGPVSGGGTIQHDPATGDYVGALVLRLGKRVTITCVGLASTKDREGNDDTSLILIGTVEHLDLQAGFVTFDGFGLIYAADRTPRRRRRPRGPADRPAQPHPLPGRPGEAPARAGRARCARSSRRSTAPTSTGSWSSCSSAPATRSSAPTSP